jgi:hypothetical protein
MTVGEIAAALEGEGLGSQLRTEEPGLLYLGDTLIAGTSLAWLEPYYSEYSKIVYTDSKYQVPLEEVTVEQVHSLAVFWKKHGGTA